MILHKVGYQKINSDTNAAAKCAVTLGIWSTHEYNIFQKYEPHISTPWDIWEILVLVFDDFFCHIFYEVQTIMAQLDQKCR